VKVHPHLKLEAYREPIPVESLLFRTPREINCLRSWAGHLIGFGMRGVPSLEEIYKDQCENDTCCLVLCSKMYDVVTKKLCLVGITLSFYGISISIRAMYHRRQSIKLNSNDLVVNNILAGSIVRVTNPQI
jgi:hypothetical protein